ncbi:telomere length regulation protein TEL2 [Histomonas meleagridis]|uniref:telomere length regulation protein TEL2-like n=1 Tax=Histomonas meleagridis TaxID=135588 RepID=UPI00355ABA2B|nr:telomere length regulation protein TEL2 [Histomonas meleagridis]KAH0800893.1 telomere length regulation protein TEL2-like [Histomonas meleagridis]
MEKAGILAREISDFLKEDQTLLQPYLEAILTSTLPTFGSLFPVDIRLECFDLWLFAPEYPVLNVIISCLKNNQSKLICADYLKKWAKKRLYSRTIEIAQERQEEEIYNEVIALIFSIPDRVASAFADVKDSPIPELLRTNSFFDRLTTSIKTLDSTLLSKYSILRLTKYIWKASFTAPQIAEAALKISPSALSPFILSLLEDTPKQMASSVLAVIYPSIKRVQDLLYHFLTQKVMNDHAVNVLIDFLVGQGKTLEALEKCGEIWSRHRLITQMSTALHRQLSIAILRLLPRTTQDQLKSCNATSLIMSGVSAHISISSPEIRRYGLEIGERITAILIPDQAVKFDELHPKEEEDSNELAPRTPLDAKSDSDSSDVDIDSPYVEQLSDSSDDDLIPYAIDDDDKTDDQKLLHPRELIALFRTDENDVDRYKKFQTAISSSADIIKKMTQQELTHFGSELLTILLTVDNEYNQDDFDENRRNALVAMMTTFPVPVSKMVVGELQKKRTHSLGRKVQLLSAISYAASEMSELPKPEKQTVTLIEAHTRRWGRARTKITAVSSSNKFSPCASIYFYGIINSLELDKLIIEEDGLEASQALTTLAVIIEAAGESVLELEAMAKDMLQIVLVLRGIRPPNARRALLFAASCAVRALKEYRGNDEIGEFLVSMAEDDPDEMCREIAQGTCEYLAQRHEDDLQKLIPGNN